MYSNKIKRVSSKEDVPKDHHYAIIVYKSYSTYVEGDQRSKDYPGHGYPAHYETHESFEHYVTKDKNEWELEIKALHFKKQENFIFFEVQKLGSFEVNISIK